MSEDNVEKFADYTDSAMTWSVEQLLEQNLEDIRSGNKVANKAIIIYLKDDEDDYELSSSQAQMKNSEVVCLLETLKLYVASAMGII